MTATIFPAYLGLLCILFGLFSFNVSRHRMKLKVAFGDGGKPELLRAIRAHANMAEFLPLQMLLLIAIEQLAPALWAHLFGCAVILTRLVLNYGILQPRHPNRFRFIGAASTYTMLFVGGGFVLVAGLLRLFAP